MNDLFFRAYSVGDKEDCLGIFDANCPEFFCPNERNDYTKFLDANPAGYEVCLLNGKLAGAFGLIDDRERHGTLSWILLDPCLQGLGIGSAIMKRVNDLARATGLVLIDIAASHKSAPFFAKFGARSTTVIDNGWGPGMDRVDMEMRVEPSC